MAREIGLPRFEFPIVVVFVQKQKFPKFPKRKSLNFRSSAQKCFEACKCASFLLCEAKRDPEREEK
jgi:hypothetical protein